ncbi:DUF6233 domain-containing protein [Streptomyces sp. NPDC059597]|uniref:DUF6233 domain-containing protein n=1 Tax=Streptomyces sp. NPDC059597 TaxID=3346879 RepID=UPI003685B602
MHDQSDRLAQLRFLERVQTADLERTRRWIADEERRQQDRRRGQAQRPPAPDWVLAYSLGGRTPQAVHTGDCRMAGKHTKPATREAALRALTEGLPACTHCRPDTLLGVLD